MGELATASADVVVLDAFDGGHIPAELTTREFLTDVARVLRPDGVLLSNVADGPPLDYLRRALATADAAFGAVAVVADPALFKRRRFGNFVIAAGPTPQALPVVEIEQAAARAPWPRRVLHSSELTRLVAGAAPISDADAQDSPEPPDEFWRVTLV
jgi:spermidine synthase